MRSVWDLSDPFGIACNPINVMSGPPAKEKTSYEGKFSVVVYSGNACMVNTDMHKSGSSDLSNIASC
jgi:hypothetical protein